MWGTIPYIWCTLWISECFRLTREGGYFLMFTDWRQLPSTTDALQAGGFIWRGVIAWDKTRAARSSGRGWFRNQCEYVVWGTKGSITKAGKEGPFDGCVRYSVRQRDKFHLTGKPTPLMEHLVQIVPAPGLVLDPFMGSGTTGVACCTHGRRFVGIEREAQYFQIAQRRLVDADRTKSS